jgi:nucleoid-associated protein YgaU
MMLFALSVEAQRMGRQQYIAKYHKWAVDEMNKTGIPASITLAQGILESDCGNSRLALEANNHFGIKCHSDWSGDKMYHDDDKPQECFRVYPSAAESFADHSLFLTSKSRYASLFELDRTDYVGWAKGLRKAGYATDPKYADLLIAIIEQECLYDYDRGAAGTAKKTTYKRPAIKGESGTASASASEGKGKSAARKVSVRKDVTFEINPLHEHEVRYNNGVRYIELVGGDTFESIAKEFHLMVSELYKYNDLAPGADIGQMKYLYIRSKRNRAHPDCSTHTVRKGDTLWSVAHKYGIKLKKLQRFNRLLPDAKLGEGTTLNLRK